MTKYVCPNCWKPVIENVPCCSLKSDYKTTVKPMTSNPFRPEDKWSIADDAGDAVVVTSLVHTRHDCHYVTSVRAKSGDPYRFCGWEGYMPTKAEAIQWHEYALARVKLDVAREDLRAFAAKKERRCWQIRGLGGGWGNPVVKFKPMGYTDKWLSIATRRWQLDLKGWLRSLQRKRRQATPATRRNDV